MLSVLEQFLDTAERFAQGTLLDLLLGCEKAGSGTSGGSRVVVNGKQTLDLRLFGVDCRRVSKRMV